MARANCVFAIFGVFLGLFCVGAPARDTERGVLALDQALRDLASDLRALMIVARPGAEDLETLALLRRSYGIRTRVLYLTRGESTSRIPGPAPEKAEGDLHAAQARAATAVVGAEARFLDFPDVGPSRSTQEIWGRWGGSDALRAIVGAIREFRPQLLLTVAVGKKSSAADEVARGLVRKAFAAAADPDEFATAGPAFAPLRLVAPAAGEEARIRLDVGRVDLVRGESYAEMGAAARREYGDAPPKPEPGASIRAFRVDLPEGRTSDDDVLAGIEVPRREWLTEEARSGTRQEILTRLLNLRAKEARPPIPPGRMGAAVAAALGLDLRVVAPPDGLVEDEAAEIGVDLVNAGPRTIVLEALRVRSDPGVDADPVSIKAVSIPGGGSRRETIAVSGVSPGDRWLEIAALFRLDTGEGLFAVARRVVAPVRTAFTGRLSRWERLIRPVFGRASAALEIENRSSGDLAGEVIVNIDGTDAVRIRAPERIHVPAGQREVFPVDIEIVDREEQGLFPVRFQIGSFLIRDVLRLVDVEVPREIRTAVIATNGDTGIRLLRAIGVRAKLLTDAELEILDLGNFDTILVGERPLAGRPVLRRVWPRLLEFVEGGGNLVMSSCPHADWDRSMAPYPLSFGAEKVTEENAEIVMSANDHRLLRFPNRISDEDFEGWVRERGRSFPEGFSDSDYETVLQVADVGRPVLPALIVAEKGRGTFLQSSLSLRLQIENLNPGAIKLLANMISYPFRR